MSTMTVIAPIQKPCVVNTSFEPLTNPQMIDIPEILKQDTGSEDKYADMANVFGKSVQYLFALEKDYYWNATASTVRRGGRRMGGRTGTFAPGETHATTQSGKSFEESKEARKETMGEFERPAGKHGQ